MRNPRKTGGMLLVLALMCSSALAWSDETRPACPRSYALNAKTCVCELKPTANPFGNDPEKAAACAAGAVLNKEKCICAPEAAPTGREPSGESKGPLNNK